MGSEMMACESVGTLFVTPESTKIHVVVDRQIVEYARALLPPNVVLNRTRYDPHITLVRGEQVDPVRWAAAQELHGLPVPFRYDPRIVAGEVYWWLRAWSDELVEVRRSLGLPDLWWTCRPPDGEEVFHITVGNTKVLT